MMPSQAWCRLAFGNLGGDDRFSVFPAGPVAFVTPARCLTAIYWNRTFDGRNRRPCSGWCHYLYPLSSCVGRLCRYAPPLTAA